VILNSKYVIHRNIDEKLLKKIIILKNQQWKYSHTSHKKWIKNNLKSSDVHIVLFIKKKLVGYTMLRKRKLIIKKDKKNFLYFDTHIVDNKFRKLIINNQKISNHLMTLAKKYILKNKNLAFLLCQKKLFKYYKNNGWYQINKNQFEIDGKKKLFGFMFGKVNRYKYYNFII
jgi:hypothetical protein